MIDVLIRREIWTQRHAQRKDDVKRHRENMIFYKPEATRSEERGEEQILPPHPPPLHPLAPQREYGPSIDFEFLDSRTVRQ